MAELSTPERIGGTINALENGVTTSPCNRRNNIALENGGTTSPCKRRNNIAIENSGTTSPCKNFLIREGTAVVSGVQRSGWAEVVANFRGMSVLERF
jgi:hypothetical protein